MPHKTWNTFNGCFLSLHVFIAISDDPEGGSSAGDTTLTRQFGDGSGSPGDTSNFFSAIRRSGVPIVMVQSTEDALIGSPLALVLRQEVGRFRRVDEKHVRSYLPVFCVYPAPAIAANLGDLTNSCPGEVGTPVLSQFLRGMFRVFSHQATCTSPLVSNRSCTRESWWIPRQGACLNA